MSWQHLVASTAILGLFDQVRLGGRIYSDGGLLYAVPLWVAAEMGATKALVIDVLPTPPGSVARLLVGAIRTVSPFRAPVVSGIKVDSPGAAAAARAASPIHLLDSRQCGVLDPGWGRTGRRDETFHCELF